MWVAGCSNTSFEIGANIEPAADMGPALVEAKFQDITTRIPDARWAAPGDVIVYRWTDEELARRRKLKNNPNYKNMGHIDIRTYDGYLSDFFGSRLPEPSKFVVTGIYRKYHDPMPILRIKAFLKMLREWECHGIEDDKRYFRLQNSLNGSYYFLDTSSHPYSKQESKTGSFSGAYQIHFKTWNELVTKYGLPSDFSCASQDRMAVALIENRRALGKIRNGEIREALTSTTLPDEWSSLPGGVNARKEIRDKQKYVYTIDDVIDRYSTFLNELIEK